jgi:hypothetical protein
MRLNGVDCTLLIDIHRALSVVLNDERVYVIRKLIPRHSTAVDTRLPLHRRTLFSGRASARRPSIL